MKKSLSRTVKTFLTLALAAAGAAAEPAPISLTASDGSGLKLVSLVSRGVVEGPLAFTELHLAFENPQGRVIEGQFRITLPQGASVGRFAMKQEQGWQEGEVVEKKKARMAYEDFLHRRQDPALLEQAAGNEFSARVFPIPARGVKELIVSYSQELYGPRSSYILPLRGLPELGALDVSVASAGRELASLSKEHVVPAADFIAPAAADGAAAVRQGDLVVARVRPAAEARPDKISSLLVLFDSSASRALGFEAQLKLLERLTAGLEPRTPLTVAAFDQSVEKVFSGTAGGFGAAGLRALRRRGALGASDLQAAFRWTKEELAKNPARRVLVIGDGVATAGETGPEELAALVHGLKKVGVERLDAIAAGGIRDEALLKRLTTAGLARDGELIDAGEEPAAIVRRLSEETRSGLAVKVSGAAWVWPKTVDGVQAGDEVLVYAELPERSEVKLSIGGLAMSVAPRALKESERPLVERAWAKAKIESLLAARERADGDAAKDKLAAEIVALSTKHRVLSPLTSLLVLETEQDYARYGIDRNALAGILIVDGTGLRRLDRAADSVASAMPPVRPPVVEVVKAKRSLLEKASNAFAAPLQSMISGAADSVAMAATSAAALPPSEAPRAEYESVASQSVAALRGGAGGGGLARPRAMLRQVQAMAAPAALSEGSPVEPLTRGPEPYEGKFKTVMDLVAAGKAREAASAARAWLEESPGDVLALVALGQARQACGDLAGAARAYGSIIDLYPDRADLRRFSGERLESLAKGGALDLAIDAYRKAVEQRPDHPHGHRLLAFALLKKGRWEEAFKAAADGAARQYPEQRFPGVRQILSEDLGLISAAWIKAEPARKADILARVKAAGGTLENAPSLRFVLNWETDNNDVDFHIIDRLGHHAFYQAKHLETGGDLYADITTGYGPECFTIRQPRDKRAGPYTLQAHYYSRGPMGYGMGKLEVIEHDGRGGLTFSERPYVVMTDQAFVDLGKADAEEKAPAALISASTR